MTKQSDGILALWTWPMQVAQLTHDLMETVTGAQSVIAARLPMIGTAFQNPIAADYRELGRMVTEKVAAFDASGRASTSVAAVVRRAGERNARALGRVAGGGFLWPQEWLELAEANLTALAAMSRLPAAALAPIHSGVVANRKRLG